MLYCALCRQSSAFCRVNMCEAIFLPFSTDALSSTPPPKPMKQIWLKLSDSNTQYQKNKLWKSWPCCTYWKHPPGFDWASTSIAPTGVNCNWHPRFYLLGRAIPAILLDMRVQPFQRKSCVNRDMSMMRSINWVAEK